MEEFRALRQALDRLKGSPEVIHALDCLLAPLKAYDAVHGADLIHTLRIFLESGGNIALTGERLFLHRNSVVYRLQRIQDVAGLDLRDDEYFAILALASILSTPTETEHG